MTLLPSKLGKQDSSDQSWYNTVTVKQFGQRYNTVTLKQFGQVYGGIVSVRVGHAYAKYAKYADYAHMRNMRTHIDKSLKCLESYREKCLGKRVIRDNQANATKQRISRESRIL